MAKHNASKTAKVAASKKSKLGRKPKPANETPAMCFKRIVNARLGRIGQSLKALESCTRNVKANVANDPGNGYFGTPEQWNSAMAFISKRVRRLEKCIANGKPFTEATRTEVV